MKKKINQLVSEYKRGNIVRREFIKKLAVMAGGTTAAAGMIETSRILCRKVRLREYRTGERIHYLPRTHR